jgi:hypothetical protein
LYPRCISSASPDSSHSTSACALRRVSADETAVWASGNNEVMTDSPASGSARDRGPDGRARNARPRDALGRPLPYGSEEVPRQAEGIRRTPRETIDEAQHLLDAGRPFHAHEVFEDAWKFTSTPERELWKGLAQLAVGITHLARGNLPGARTLVRRGTAAIQPFLREGPFGLDIAGLVDWGAEFVAALDGSNGKPVVVATPRLLEDR